jgi:hypothetical protein
MQRHGWVALLGVLAVAAGCTTGRSVVGGDDPADGGADVGALDAGADAGLDSGQEAAVDAPPADLGPSACRSNTDCADAGADNVCDLATGRCVGCTVAPDSCAPTQHCDPMARRCVDGCHRDEGCAATPATPRCDTARNACVACTADTQCAAGQRCVANACVLGCSPERACPGADTCCDGACVNTASSAAHCGACGAACMSANGAPACVSSRCTVGRCDTGFGDCDNDSANGCEVALGTATAHCGMCGNACRAGANATATCAAGRCGLRCGEGFGDCDGDAANGCEVNLGTSATHCGACGTACPMGSNGSAVCAAGRCGLRCAEGFGDCDGNAANGCEANLNTSAMTCGACGTRCDTGTACTAGRCGCPGLRGTLCGGVCRDLASDRLNCGACGQTCGTGEACVFGGGPSVSPACQPGCFITVNQIAIPGGPEVVGYDPAFGTPRVLMGMGLRGAVVFDDITQRVAALAASVPSEGDILSETARIEGLVRTSLGVGTTPALLGRRFTTHDGQPGTRSTFRVLRTASAAALRNSIVGPLTGAVAGEGVVFGTGPEFVVEVATVRRVTGLGAGRTDVLVAVALRADVESTMLQTALRVADFANATGLAAGEPGLAFACQELRTSLRAPRVDVLWTVDTSGSMASFQTQLGNAAAQFFTRLRTAGVDFRVAAVGAGTGINLQTPGFTWIAGDDTQGPQRLCQRVTYAACPTVPGDALVPYPMAGNGEEPTAAAVITHRALLVRQMAGETNPDQRLRDDARMVAMLVTDETGGNDFSRYFSTAIAPDSGLPYGTPYSTTVLTNIVSYFQRNGILTYGIVPVSTRTCGSANVIDLPRCTIEGNGGLALQIGQATEAAMNTLLTRLLADIGGPTAEYRLDATPISSMIRVTVRGVAVPRSRTNGFDYDPVARAVVFYGTQYRPMEGDPVVISYRRWNATP